MLKIYLYGYLNRVQSSRRLKREAQRNVELMWLTGRLAPDFKTIANFRQTNGAAIQCVCSQFIVLCRQLGLFTRAVVAIDGSKMKAVNNRDKNYTAAKVASRRKQVQDNIDRYLDALDRADREDSDVAEPKAKRLTEKIARLRAQMRDLAAREEEVRNAPDQQVSLTDPDARAMASAGRGTSIVGYNLQAAVDAEHHLIVARELLNIGYDRRQLSPMAAKAKDAMGVEALAGPARQLRQPPPVPPVRASLPRGHPQLARPVRAPVAPGSAVALTVPQAKCAAALVRRHADGQGERRSPLVLPLPPPFRRRLAFSNDPGLIQEASEGQVARSIRAMQFEEDIRVDPQLRADPFVQRWQALD